VKRLAILWLVAILAAPGIAWSCRCEQRPLGDYFAGAEVVAVARLKESNDLPNRRLLAFELLAPHYKGSSSPAAGDVVTFATAISTASCGIQPDQGAVYIVFAYDRGDEPDRLWIDSCSGTRVHLSSSLDEPHGFVDVPARFVMQQLNGLAGMEVLRDVAANAPDPGDTDSDRIIGLLDLHLLGRRDAVELFAEPDPTSERVAQVEDYRQIETREFAYERPAAVVFANPSGWYKVRLPMGDFAWLPAAVGDTFYPYGELPPGRLAYLKRSWSGFVWPEAGAGLPIRSSARSDAEQSEFPARVLESVVVAGMPWFRIELYDGEICTSQEPAVSLSGWVPGYGRSGEETVWFYSRGC
jgi:hypothetical protein